MSRRRPCVNGGPGAGCRGRGPEGGAPRAGCRGRGAGGGVPRRRPPRQASHISPPAPGPRPSGRRAPRLPRARGRPLLFPQGPLVSRPRVPAAPVSGPAPRVLAAPGPARPYSPAPRPRSAARSLRAGRSAAPPLPRAGRSARSPSRHPQHPRPPASALATALPQFPRPWGQPLPRPAGPPLPAPPGGRGGGRGHGGGHRGPAGGPWPDGGAVAGRGRGAWPDGGRARSGGGRFPEPGVPVCSKWCPLLSDGPSSSLAGAV